MASSLVLDGLEVELCLSVGHELGEREVVLLEVRPLLLQVRQLHVCLVVGQLLLQGGVFILNFHSIFWHTRKFKPLEKETSE